MNRKWVEKCRKIEELASHYSRHPLSSPYQPRLGKPWQPSSVWKLFHRQAAALQYVKTCKEDVHVFALETVLDDVGRRLYLVSTYTEFWFYYSKRSKTLAHCYEVIPADTVCKLYFDLEFYKPANPEADGQKMVTLLIKFFIRKLEEHYGLKCSADFVINLDSSTDEKFSRHLIFSLPNAAFKDNIHVGNFIKTVLQPLFPQSTSTHKDPGTSVIEAAKIHDDTSKCNIAEATKGTCNGGKNMPEELCELSSFLVNDKYGGKQPFIDLGVYTKNRNFRIYKSSKLGKNAVFELAEDNQFSCKPPKHLSAEEYIFLCSLISNVRFTDTLKILTCASPSDKNGSSRVSSGGSMISGSDMSGYKASPYPEIDQFIWSVVTREGFQGDEDWCLTMDENGNIKKTQQIAAPTEEHLSGESKDQSETCDKDWDDCIDDACILEAAEDVELADIADHSLAEWNLEHTDIPDELLLEAINDHTSVQQ
uniref:DNA-directed primase/polymerase protein n=1 Tax=Pyxicephalus adspersus TaxID=30357 RepID=A0AAV3AMS8_PYXAD|nr:TPA: hypothetical protein GDO54_009382 [Pyxicephalus adspersus]